MSLELVLKFALCTWQSSDGKAGAGYARLQEGAPRGVVLPATAFAEGSRGFVDQRSNPSGAENRPKDWVSSCRPKEPERLQHNIRSNVLCLIYSPENASKLFWERTFPLFFFAFFIYSFFLLLFSRFFYLTGIYCFVVFYMLAYFPFFLYFLRVAFFSLFRIFLILFSILASLISLVFSLLKFVFFLGGIRRASSEDRWS